MNQPLPPPPAPPPPSGATPANRSGCGRPLAVVGLAAVFIFALYLILVALFRVDTADAIDTCNRQAVATLGEVTGTAEAVDNGSTIRVVSNSYVCEVDSTGALLHFEATGT